MSTGPSLTHEEIISIYPLRFKIETSFAEQKNDMGCYSCHFWSTALPKRKRWKKVELPAGKNLQTRILRARQAMYSFVCLATIATGINGFKGNSEKAAIHGIFELGLRNKS